jgi:tetratricopeptide (TPR) repeat protein
MVPHGSLAVRTKLADIYLEANELGPALRLFDAKVSAERAVLASLFERAGRLEEASAYYASVVVGPNDRPALVARVSAERLVSRGLVEGAITTLQRWAMIAPEDLYARVRLVELLHQDGRIEAAHEEGRRTLELIDDPRLKERLKQTLAGL